MIPITKEDINRVINAFCRLEIDIHPYTDFKVLFGDNLGDHLSDKFIKYDRSMVNLWFSLDYANREILAIEIKHYLETKKFNEEFEITNKKW